MSRVPLSPGAAHAMNTELCPLWAPPGTCAGRAGGHWALWGRSHGAPALAVLNFSPCPCCDCRGRSPALAMCLSLQPTARPQDFQINN